MDRLIISEKLEALRRCVKRVESKRADSADALRGDVDRQDIRKFAASVTAWSGKERQ